MHLSKKSYKAGSEIEAMSGLCSKKRMLVNSKEISTFYYLFLFL